MPHMAHRILIADPNKTVRLAAQMIFAKSPDVILATAINSFDALNKMHLLKPVFTLMDAELAHQLCTNLSRTPCPVVVLRKPFSTVDLVAQVREALSSLIPQSQNQSYPTEASENNV
ncbi:MAG: hypothetical protein V4534_03545 [Myxococcota bacterium]